jgi:hypothetical protein
MNCQREEFLECEATPRLRAHDFEPILMTQVMPVGIALMLLANVSSGNVLFGNAAKADAAFNPARFISSASVTQVVNRPRPVCFSGFFRHLGGWPSKVPEDDVSSPHPKHRQARIRVLSVSKKGEKEVASRDAYQKAKYI